MPAESAHNREPVIDWERFDELASKMTDNTGHSDTDRLSESERREWRFLKNTADEIDIGLHDSKWGWRNGQHLSWFVDD